MIKKFTLASAFFIVLGLPLSLLAHATPTAYEPSAEKSLEQAPNEVSIRFTERPEPTLSQMRVFGPDGAEVHSGSAQIADGDAWKLYVPIDDAGTGQYIVVWSVVSADDGHFTRGVHSFVVGVSTSSVSVHDHDHHSTVEYKHSVDSVVSSAIELFGNGVLWAVLILLSLLYRPLRRAHGEASVVPLNRLLWWSVLFGLCLVILGVVWHIVQTAVDLVAWQGGTFIEAIWVYLASTLGINVLTRVTALIFAAVTLLLTWRFVIRSPVFTAFELFAFITLVLFAYIRALLSHATADPFYPELSTAINVLHLIEKDLWAGVVAVLFVGTFFWSTRKQILERMKYIAVFLSVNMLGLTLTATYIVWLQLKSFENLWYTEWGTQLQLLITAAVLLVLVRVVQISLARVAPVLLDRMLSFLYGIELVFVGAVIYGSSLIMLTSPPLLEPDKQTIQATDGGIIIELTESRADPEQLLLTVADERTTSLAATLTTTESGFDERVLPIEQRTGRGFSFQRAELYGKGPWSIDLQAQRHNAYDLRVSFILDESWQEASLLEGHGRTYGVYTQSMIWLGILATIAALVLIVFARGVRSVVAVYVSIQNRLSYAVLGVVLGFILLIITQFAVQAFIGNPFYKECTAQGDEWHVMQPMREGVVLHNESREGCMTANGLFHFVDFEEYQWYQNSR